MTNQLIAAAYFFLKQANHLREFDMLTVFRPSKARQEFDKKKKKMSSIEDDKLMTFLSIFIHLFTVLQINCILFTWEI